MSWTQKFAEPIRTSSGQTIRTLADARAFMLQLSPQVTWQNEWQNAADKLLLASQGKASVEEAREAVCNALVLNMRLTEARWIEN